MKYLIAKLKELEERDITVVTSRGSLSLQQTQRNQAKAELLEALYKDLKSELSKEGYSVYITSYGPVIEFNNSIVESQIDKLDQDDLCSGFISVQLDAVMKNLDTDAELDEENFLHEMEEKEARKAERESAKQAKTERDAELRAEKARRREEEIIRLQSRKED
jgi:hypothetical protein